jgi:hypothetical protein
MLDERVNQGFDLFDVFQRYAAEPKFFQRSRNLGSGISCRASLDV